MATTTKKPPPPADRPPLLVGLWAGDRTAVSPYPLGTPAQHAAALAGLLLAALGPGDELPDDLLVYVQRPDPAGDWRAAPGSALYELLEVIAGRRPAL